MHMIYYNNHIYITPFDDTVHYRLFNCEKDRDKLPPVIF